MNEFESFLFHRSGAGLLEQRFYIYRLLHSSNRRKLEGDIQVFLAEKSFEGCGEQLITDEVRVLVAAQAAQACLLLLHQETDYYPKLRSILVYPTTFVARYASAEKWENVDPSHRVFAGLASPEGAVVLAWDATIAGASENNGGSNPTSGRGPPHSPAPAAFTSGCDSDRMW